MVKGMAIFAAAAVALVVTLFVAAAQAPSGELTVRAPVPDLSATIFAAAALVTALGTAIAQVLTARRNTVKLDTITTTQTDNAAKLDVIKGSVDGAATKNEAKIDELHKTIATLVAHGADMKQIAAVLAATNAAKDTTLGTSAAPVSVEVVNAPPVKVEVVNTPPKK